LSEAPDKLIAPAELEVVFPSEAENELAFKSTIELELDPPGNAVAPDPADAYVALAPSPVDVPKAAPPPVELYPAFA
jgi:hypothetical protein